MLCYVSVPNTYEVFAAILMTVELLFVLINPCSSPNPNDSATET